MTFSTESASRPIDEENSVPRKLSDPQADNPMALHLSRRNGHRAGLDFLDDRVRKQPTKS